MCEYAFVTVMLYEGTVCEFESGMWLTQKPTGDFARAEMYILQQIYYCTLLATGDRKVREKGERGENRSISVSHTQWNSLPLAPFHGYIRIRKA